jgi:hypothetical protein
MGELTVLHDPGFWILAFLIGSNSIFTETRLKGLEWRLKRLAGEDDD